jgi:uncharacterized membrane protein YcaP (DUF421 family)
MKDVALADGALAFALLIGLQFVFTWSSVRWRWVRQLITGEPRMLYSRGAYLAAALRQSRVTREEVRAAVRSAGVGSLEAVQAVVLETDGSFSVVHRSVANNDESSSLVGVHRP